MCQNDDHLLRAYRTCADIPTAIRLSWLLQLRHYGDLAALALTRELDEHGRRHLGYLLEIIERRAGQLRRSVAAGDAPTILREVA